MELSPSYKHFDSSHATEGKLVNKGTNPNTGVDNYGYAEVPRKATEVETQYVQDSDTLAGIYDGTITESDHFIDGEVRFEGPVDHAIYLDKSARNVRYIMNGLWPQLSEAPMPPKSSFIDIDKKTWLGLMGSKGTEQEVQNPDMDEVSLDKLDPTLKREMLARVRALYLSPEDLDRLDEDNLDMVWDMPTVLDGKHVALVDEMKSSGATLKIADLVMQAAIPDAKFEPVYWMRPNLLRWSIYDNDGNKQSDEFSSVTTTAWYNQHSPSGKGGIEDADPEKSKHSPSKRQRLGAYVLSRVPMDETTGRRAPIDKRTLEMRHDMQLLAKRLRENEVKYLPSRDRSPDDFKARIEAYYGIPFDQWRAQRR